MWACVMWNFRGSQEDGGVCLFVDSLKVPYLQDWVSYGVFFLQLDQISTQERDRYSLDAPRE